VPNPKPHPSRRRRARGRGQALVEFALVIPIFLLLVAGMIDFGLGLNASITVSNAAREGARLGVVTPLTASASDFIGPTGTIQTRVKSVLGTGLVSGATVTVTCERPAGSTPSTCMFQTPPTSPASAAASGDSVIVTVSYDYPMIWPLAFGTKIGLSSTSKFRIE
jgi:Flp pilus assembly protein TadG